MDCRSNSCIKQNRFATSRSIERVAEEIEEIIGIDATRRCAVFSAKTGVGIAERT